MLFPPSSVELFEFGGHSFYVKRDDLTHPYLSGNKYRKLQTLLQTPSSRYKALVSYGGTQSNAMLALASLCQIKKWDFIYYIKESASHLNRVGNDSNYAYAITMGMQVVSLNAKEYECMVTEGMRVADDTVFVPQGGAIDDAKLGVSFLAEEIDRFQHKKNIAKLNLITPSGTGTTAYFLAQCMPHNRVMTTSGVGTNTYLKEQMQKFGNLPENLIFLESQKKYHFGKLHRDLLKIYQELKIAGIEFDLLYAPKLWIALLNNMQYDAPYFYIHSGGVSGNKSMLERYDYKGWLER